MYVFGMVVEALIYELTFESPYVPIHVPFTAKHPAVMFHPTLEVEVAWPEILRPRTVVVPKPVPETVRADVDVVAVPATVVVER